MSFSSLIGSVESTTIGTRMDDIEGLTAKLKALSTSSNAAEKTPEATLDSIVKQGDSVRCLKLFLAFTKESFGKIDPFKVISAYRQRDLKNTAINPFIVKVANAFFEEKEFDKAKRAILEVRKGRELSQRDEFLITLYEAFYAQKRFEDALQCIFAIKDSARSKEHFVRFSKLDLGDFDRLSIACAFHERHSRSPELNTFIFGLAQSSLNAKDVKAARVAITQLGCDCSENQALRDQFLVRLSEACHCMKNFEEGLLAIAEISNSALCQAQFFAYTQQGLGNFDPLHVVEIFQKRLPNALFINQFIYSVAETLFANGNFIAARLMVSKVTSGSPEVMAMRDRFLLRLFEKSCGEKSFDEALQCLLEIRDADMRLARFVAFSQCDLGNFNPITLIDAFLQFHRTSSSLNAFIKNAAQSYVEKGELAAAKETIVKLGCGNAAELSERDTILHNIATRWFEMGRYEEAFEAICIMRPWTSLRHTFVCRLSDQFMQTKEWSKAFSSIRSMDDSIKANSIDREAYLVKLAFGCVENAYWDIAEKAIEQIIHDEKQKVSLTYSLVESCLQSGERQMAFTIASRFKLPESPEYQILNSLTFFRVVSAYVKAKDHDMDFCAMKYMRAAIEKEFSLNGVTHKYSTGVIQSRRVSTLADSILSENFDYLMDCFRSDDWTESMDRIEQLVRSKASLQEFERHFALRALLSLSLNQDHVTRKAIEMLPKAFTKS